MKFVQIFGPQAVGKMTVGQELEKITDLKLFHNHMTIDLVSQFFNYDTDEGKRLVNLFRREIFEAVAKSDLYGLIFTSVWILDDQERWEYRNEIFNLFESYGAKIYLIELEADFDERFKRNNTPNRLLNKPTKRNIEMSERIFQSMENNHRFNSFPGEINRENYIRFDNTNIEAVEVAKTIKNTFAL